MQFVRECLNHRISEKRIQVHSTTCFILKNVFQSFISEEPFLILPNAKLKICVDSPVVRMACINSMFIENF